MKILVGVPEKTARGGINACEPPFLEALAANGVEVRTIVTAYDNPPGITLGERVRRVRESTRALVAEFKDGGYDLVHLNTALDRRAAMRDSFQLYHLTRAGARVFVKFHGSDPAMLGRSGMLDAKLSEFVTSRAARVGVLSSEERDELVKFGLADEKVKIVRNVVAGKVFPQVENTPDGPFRMVFASRLIETKGLIDVVGAVGLLTEQGLDATLDVFGDGDAREAAEALAQASGTADRIRFRGHVSEEEVARGYAAADVLVFPTYHNEGFPMVVFNAVRAGLPIITTQVRAAKDYLRDREHCLFCGAQSPKSVARRVAELAGDEALRKKMTSNNLALASRFEPDVVAGEYLEIYREITGS